MSPAPASPNAEPAAPARPPAPPPLAAALAALRAAARLPSADDALAAFLAVQAQQNLAPYPAQEEALLELSVGKHVILATPTGSGKSLVAEYLHFLSACQGRKSYYTCPIKALVSEKFFNLCRLFGAENVGMLTGDASINPKAAIICCTAEVLANICLRPSARQAAAAVIMDEFHYYGDAARGTAWQLPLLAMRQAQFLLMSATLGDVTDICQQLEAETGHGVAHVQGSLRPVPLDYSYKETPLQETLAELMATQKTPVYVVHFSQREAIEAAQSALSVDYLGKEEKARLARLLVTFRFDTPFGKTVRRFLGHGIGVHHAGLLPKYRLLVERLAQSGLLRVIMGTDTLGVGINVPIRTVLFTKLCKFDGDKVGILPVRDFRQIAGRAGRKGYDTQGSVVAQAPEHVIENKRLQSRVADDPKKLRKLVKKKPPAKGFVPWDANTFTRLIQDAPERLVPRFVLNLHLMLAVLQQDPFGLRELYRLIAGSFVRPHEKKQLRRKARTLFQTLRTHDIVTVVRPRAKPAEVHLNAQLGEDFSLTHALTLFLLDAIARLDNQADSYPLDVLSCVESILDNPDGVLRRLADHEKTQAMGALKAQGVPFEERVAKLDNVTYPRPLADWLYAAFDMFAADQPWAREAQVRPKGVARVLVEGAFTFAEFVRDYGLERQEGVLLRYLSQVVRALETNLPGAFVDDVMHDVLTNLRAAVGQVDASLMTAWQQLGQTAGAAAPDPAGKEATAAAAVRLVTVADWWRRRQKACQARLRTEMHRLLGAMVRGDWEEARLALAPEAEMETETDAGAATQPDAVANVADAARARRAEQLAFEQMLQRAWQPVVAEHPQVDGGPQARRPAQTLVRASGAADGTLLVEQILLDRAPALEALPGQDPHGRPGAADRAPAATAWVLRCTASGGAPWDDRPLLRFVEVAS